MARFGKSFEELDKHHRGVLDERVTHFEVRDLGRISVVSLRPPTEEGLLIVPFLSPSDLEGLTVGQQVSLDTEFFGNRDGDQIDVTKVVQTLKVDEADLEFGRELPYDRFVEALAELDADQLDFATRALKTVPPVSTYA
jgi:hypothetical protein